MRNLRPAMLGLAAILLSGCASEPLYMSSSCAPGDLSNCVPASSAGDYVLVAPYFSSLQNKVTVEISNGAAKSGSQTADNKPPKKKKKGKAADAANPTPNDSSGSSDAGSGTPTMTASLIPLPKGRTYLYMKKNSLYSNNINMTVADDGLLSSSDTSSSQQVTAALSEIGQSVGAVLKKVAALPAPAPKSFLKAKGKAKAKPKPAPTPKTVQKSDAALCIAALASNAPIYSDFVYDKDLVGNLTADKDYLLPKVSITSPDENSYKLWLEIENPLSIVPDDLSKSGSGNSQANGIFAFESVPITVQLMCQVNSKVDLVPIGPVKKLNVYADPMVLTPTRDFLTEPHDTYTFSEGIITGHKYSDKSSTKTLFDSVTAPVRALLSSGTSSSGGSGDSSSPSGSTSQ